MTPDEVRSAVEDGTIMQYICSHKVQPCDTLFIETGTVHALRKGAFVAEIQENSDLTYRLFDYNRTDAQGNRRPLHIDKAIDVLNYSSVGTELVKHSGNDIVQNLIQSQYFTVNKLCLDRTVQRDYAPLDSFVIYLCTEGSLTINTTELPEDAGAMLTLSEGECCLIPAVLNDVTITPESKAELLEIYMEM